MESAGVLGVADINPRKHLWTSYRLLLGDLVHASSYQLGFYDRGIYPSIY